MDYSQWAKQRSKQMYPGQNGRLQADWQLTDTNLVEPVKLNLPPMRSIPILFVPGIMGSNLCDLKSKPVWLLNSIKGVPITLAMGWASKKAGERQAILHPDRTKVFSGGAVPKLQSSGGYPEKHYQKRGWGEVSEASYHKFLLWLEEKLNSDLNPANWTDFTNPSMQEPATVAEKLIRKLPPGLVMQMRELPNVAEIGYPVEPVTSDDLLRRCKSTFPIYAFGYNWLGSNQDAAHSLKARIENIISENNIGTQKCTQVILVTHSMGGLVARACSQLPSMEAKIVGIVHGVMPATGAAVAYRRCKVGMRDEDFGAGLVIGSDGKEVTAVFAQSPGALQLLPSEDYGSGWLEFSDPTGKILNSLPAADPYKEIYLERKRWWGLVNEDWLKPDGGIPISWKTFAMNIGFAREFHRGLAGKYHRKTYVFYGGGTANESFSKVRWNITPGRAHANATTVGSPTAILSMSFREVRTDGSNNFYVTGEVARPATPADVPLSGAVQTAIDGERSNWEVRCGGHDSPGDGTVPARSGKAPRKAGGGSVLQQFSLSGVAHEPAYKNYSIAQQVALYAVTKLAAIADLK